MGEKNEPRPWYKRPWVIVIIVILFLGVMGAVSDNSPDEKQNTTPTPTAENESIAENQMTPTESPAQTYDIVRTDHNDTVENFYVLIETNAGETESADLAQKIKDSNCKRDCNVYLYNSADALEKDFAYYDLGGDYNTVELMQQWKEDNYVFVAEHFIGQLRFDSEDFEYFPYKDWFYDEMKSKE